MPNPSRPGRVLGRWGIEAPRSDATAASEGQWSEATDADCGSKDVRESHRGKIRERKIYKKEGEKEQSADRLSVKNYHIAANSYF